MSRVEHDARPSIAHDRTTEDTFDAFLFVPGCYDRPGKPERIRVLGGVKTLTCVEIIEERTTSESRSAETLSGGELESIHLTTEQAEWLHETLGRFLEWKKGYDAR